MRRALSAASERQMTCMTHALRRRFAPSLEAYPPKYVG
ncbi:hypothetical protein RHECNPAF_4310032 [Rhizobium etli CNPAF512]|nr:hypothetical protein RHECNPAF_4310032 [Rhizobium etli CNPAF512]